VSCAGRGTATLGARVLVATIAVLAALTACGDDEAATSSGTGGAAATAASTSDTAATSTASSATTGNGAGGESVVDCGPVSGFPASEACSACSNASCCEELAACAAKPACGGFASCLEACGADPACFDACGLDHFGDTPEGLQVVACQLEHCPAECGLEDRDCRYYVPPPPVADRDACRECVDAACCDELDAQFDAEVLEFFLCSLACLDAFCLRGCEEAFPAGVSATSAVFACVGTSCEAPCLPTEGGICGGWFNPDTACATCSDAECCAQHEGCGWDLGCQSARLCVLGCASPEECAACYASWPAEALGLALAMESCIGVACQGTCDGAPECGAPRGLLPATCRGCLEDSCCEPLGTCTGDAACAALLVCTTLCAGDGDCAAACEVDFPEGVEAHDALTACQTASCADDCG
jgi:hypothetical protein